MFEIKVTIEAPEIAGAISKLADAMNVKTVSIPYTGPIPKIEPATAAPTSAPAPAQTATTPAPAQTAPATAPAPIPVPTPASTPAPTSTPAPVASQPKIDMDAIARAGAGLIEKGKMAQIMDLLKRYGVQAVTQLKEEQFADFAVDLRALGAEI